MTDTFKTSVRVMGTRQIDEFHALCLLLGRRPHQLAADMVLEAIQAARKDPATGSALAELAEIRSHARAQQENREAPNVIPLFGRTSR